MGYALYQAQVGRKALLHAFQKKSKKGIATPRPDMDLIKKRLKVAEEDYKSRQAGRERNR